MGNMLFAKCKQEVCRFIRCDIILSGNDGDSAWNYRI